MSSEPINIFSHRNDLSGIARLARQLDSKAIVQGPDDDWETIEFAPQKRGLFRKPAKLVLHHDREYYSGPDWPLQIQGMHQYFANFPESACKADVLRLIRSFRFSVSVPIYDLDIESQDSRLPILFAICEHLDGVFFLPSAMRDSKGRVLLGAAGQSDQHSVLPQLPPEDELMELDAPDIVPSDSDDADDYPEPDPPTPRRVAARTLALTAVSARATLELDYLQSGVDTPEVHRQSILDWVSQLGIDDELEPDEWKVLQRPVGKLDEQDFINAMWRVEGLAILAWALGIVEPPPYDELVVPPELYSSIGFLDSSAAELLETAELRPQDELDAMRDHLLAFHWRIRDFSIRPKKMDFVEFSRDCWFGSFDISKFQVIKGDLALGGKRIDKAEQEAVGKASSTAMERHTAINWLLGASELYSETDTST